MQRPSHGAALLCTGKLTNPLMEQARQGRVRLIDSPFTTLAPAVARRVVPELLGAGCSLLDLELNGVHLNGTWAATFGEAAVCSVVLRKLRLHCCGLRGPLSELRLPVLQVLNLPGCSASGSLETATNDRSRKARPGIVSTPRGWSIDMRHS